MRMLEETEIQEHKAKLREFKRRINRTRNRYADGDITIKKMREQEKVIKQDEMKYAANSGVIMYFGKLWKKT